MPYRLKFWATDAEAVYHQIATLRFDDRGVGKLGWINHVVECDCPSDEPGHFHLEVEHHQTAVLVMLAGDGAIGGPVEFGTPGGDVI